MGRERQVTRRRRTLSRGLLSSVLLLGAGSWRTSRCAVQPFGRRPLVERLPAQDEANRDVEGWRTLHAGLRCLPNLEPDTLMCSLSVPHCTRAGRTAGASTSASYRWCLEVAALPGVERCDQPRVRFAPLPGRAVDQRAANWRSAARRTAVGQIRGDTDRNRHPPTHATRRDWTRCTDGDRARAPRSREALKRHDSRTELRGCAPTRGGPCSGVAIVWPTGPRPPLLICEPW